MPHRNVKETHKEVLKDPEVFKYYEIERENMKTSDKLIIIGESLLVTIFIVTLVTTIVII